MLAIDKTAYDSYEFSESLFRYRINQILQRDVSLQLIQNIRSHLECHTVGWLGQKSKSAVLGSGWMRSTVEYCSPEEET